MSVAPDVASLRGRCVLLAEDRFLIALGLWRLLADEGCGALGPAPTLDEAFCILARTRPDAAVVATRLGGMSAAPLAGALARRGVPFLLATAEPDPAEPVFRGVPAVGGPGAARAALDALRRLPLHSDACGGAARAGEPSAAAHRPRPRPSDVARTDAIPVPTRPSRP